MRRGFLSCIFVLVAALVCQSGSSASQFMKISDKSKSLPLLTTRNAHASMFYGNISVSICMNVV